VEAAQVKYQSAQVEAAQVKYQAAQVEAAQASQAEKVYQKVSYNKMVT
jgi:hypothetical protein